MTMTLGARAVTFRMPADERPTSPGREAKSSRKSAAPRKAKAGKGKPSKFTPVLQFLEQQKWTQEVGLSAVYYTLPCTVLHCMPHCVPCYASLLMCVILYE